MRAWSVLLAACVGAALACSTPTSPTGSDNSSLPAVYQRFKSTVTIKVDGSTVVLTSNGVPDHNSPYFGVGNPGYEAPTAGMTVNPNKIASQDFVIRVPLSPATTTASDTPMGPIGMATNGVAIFNQYAAGKQPVASEFPTFDRYNGHPQQTGVYHYHIEPVWLTSVSTSAFIGVLLDGFPIYGPTEATGSLPAGLDSCNGHTHATADVPNGIYHYHVTTNTPYISGCFKGTPGSIG
jgi:hypothetical protein